MADAQFEHPQEGEGRFHVESERNGHNSLKDSSRMSDRPIACTLPPAELETRSKQLLPGLVSAATKRASIDGGYRFEFGPTTETLRAIVAMMDAERQCCRFLRFQMTTQPDEGPILRDVTGPDGTAECLGDLIGPA